MWDHHHHITFGGFVLNLTQSSCFVPPQVPFPVLQGEGVEYLGHADEAIIAISNYRLHIKYKDSVINVSAGHRP